MDENITRRNLKKGVILSMIALIILILTFCAILYYTTIKIKAYIPQKLIGITSSVIYKIETIEKLGANYISIKGWAYIPNEKIKKAECHIILKDHKSGNYLKVPTDIAYREDISGSLNVSSYEETKNDYLLSGFNSLVDIRQLNASLEDYSIYLNYMNNDHYMMIETDKNLVSYFESENNNEDN